MATFGFLEIEQLVDNLSQASSIINCLTRLWKSSLVISRASYYIYSSLTHWNISRLS